MVTPLPVHHLPPLFSTTKTTTHQLTRGQEKIAVDFFTPQESRRAAVGGWPLQWPRRDFPPTRLKLSDLPMIGRRSPFGLKGGEFLPNKRGNISRNLFSLFEQPVLQTNNDLLSRTERNFYPTKNADGQKIICSLLQDAKIHPPSKAFR